MPEQLPVKTAERHARKIKRCLSILNQRLKNARAEGCETEIWTIEKMVDGHRCRTVKVEVRIPAISFSTEDDPEP
jgi:hypothetical protein